MAYKVPDGYFGSGEVCLLAGITLRQLDYWARTLGSVIAQPAKPGQGTHRIWSPVQVTCIRLIALLRGPAGCYGADPRMIQECLEGYLAAPPGIDCLLVTETGEPVYIPSDEMPEFLRERPRPTIAIYLPNLWKGLRGQTV